MNSEWPQAAPNVTINDEREALLHTRRETSCLRYFWITFFCIFLAVGLATGGYLLLLEEMGRPLSEDNFSLITRKGWKAKDATFNIPKLEAPVKRVVLTSTNTSECSTETQCSDEIHKVQIDHLNRLREPDIAYNFLIAGDGQTYEGRGWNYQAMISSSNDNRTVVVAFIGVFNNSLPTNKQINQANSFLEVAERMGKLTTCYSIEKGGNQRNGFLESITNYFQKHFKRKRSLC